MEEKDCELVFCDKQTYKFSSKDLHKALAWGKDKNIWAIKTPWMVLHPMDEEEFENVKSIVFDGPVEDPLPEDLI